MPAASAGSGSAPEYTLAQYLGFEIELSMTTLTFFFLFQLQEHPKLLGWNEQNRVNLKVHLHTPLATNRMSSFTELAL